MIYPVTVYFKGSWFGKKYKNVKADGLLLYANKDQMPVRYLIMSDDSRVEMPFDSVRRIDFGAGRATVIAHNMNKESGAGVKV